MTYYLIITITAWAFAALLVYAVVTGGNQKPRP